MTSRSKVHPDDSTRPRLLLVFHDALNRAFQAAGKYWNSIHVGHRGRYSVQRLLSFRDYYERTSPTRVFFVCTLSLVPAFLVPTLMECIPLKPPEEGWRANYAFWIRLFVSSLPISFGAVFQVIEVLEPGVLSATGIIVTAVGSCAGYVLLTMVLAATWKFPVPFGYIFCVPPFVAIYLVLMVVCIGPRVLARSPVLRYQLFAQLSVVTAQAFLAIAYPLFSAVFNQLSGYQQTAFIFVLPIIKFIIKQVIAKMAAHLHECVALIVVFSVDVCNVVYVVVCMQTATSPVTTMLMIGTDALFVALALRSIYYQADDSHRRRKLQSASPSTSENHNYLRDSMALVREAFKYASKPNAPPVPIRVRSPVQLPLSVESARFISDLVHSKRRNAGETSEYLSTAVNYQARQKSDRQIVPASALDHLPDRKAPHTTLKGPGSLLALSSKSLVRQNFEDVVRSSARPTLAAPSNQRAAVMDAQDALQTLFHSEYVVMAEYVECVIPILYGVYLTCLYHLPTAAYYPHTSSLTAQKFESTLINLMVYASVEFLSFMGLNILLKRKFGFSPFYQLAFVLETQVGTLQGHLFLWVSWILQITLAHNGVDLNAPFK